MKAWLHGLRDQADSGLTRGRPAWNIVPVMVAYIWIAVGGALGSVARFWLSGLIAERYVHAFPWNTLVVNVTGSLVIGFFGALTEPDGRWFAGPGMRQFVMVGVCGGYTTFSSFSLQTLSLLRDREWLYAAANMILSVVLCLAAVWLGYIIAAFINSRPR